METYVVENITIPYGAFWDIAINSDNTTVYIPTASGKSVYKLSVADNSVQTIHLSSVAFHLTADLNNTIWVTNLNDFDSSNGAICRINPDNTVVKISNCGNRPYDITTTPYGAVWYVTNNDNRLWNINPSNNSVINVNGTGSGPVSIVAGYDSLWVANNTANTIGKYDLCGTLLYTFEMPSGDDLIKLALSPDKQTIYALSCYGNIYTKVINTPNNLGFLRIVSYNLSRRECECMVISTTSIIISFNKNIIFIALSDLTNVTTIATDSYYKGLAISSDFTTLWAIIDNGVFVTKVTVVPPPPNIVADAALQADNQVAASNAIEDAAVRAGVPFTVTEAVFADLQNNGIPGARNSYI